MGQGQRKTEREMTFGSLFSGIGGMDLGLERAGLCCAWQVEIDDKCQSVLSRHWPNVPKFKMVGGPHERYYMPSVRMALSCEWFELELPRWGGLSEPEEERC